MKHYEATQRKQESRAQIRCKSAVSSAQSYEPQVEHKADLPSNVRQRRNNAEGLSESLKKRLAQQRDTTMGSPQERDTVCGYSENQGDKNKSPNAHEQFLPMPGFDFTLKQFRCRSSG